MPSPIRCSKTCIAWLLTLALGAGCGSAELELEVDAGGEHAAAETRDAAPGWADAAIGPEDAGAQEHGDAGVEQTDASSAPADAGLQPVDADGGLVLADAGSGGADAGAAISCSVGGTAGWCLDVSECDGIATPGYCPGPANLQCCTPAPAGSCDPDAEPQPNAGLIEEPGVGGCPDGMVPVADFCIDRYEASLVEVLADGSTLPWSPYFNPGSQLVRAVSIRGAVPQGYISGLQAAAACAEAGKRLCTDDEWLRACRGPGGWTYPYGNALQSGVCNDHRSQHPAVEYFGTSADWIWSQLGHPCINQLPASLDPTGAREDCVTAEGIFDMMGNLHEWTADPAGTFRGGYYVDTLINGNGCLYRTTAHDSSHWDYSTGFRCCAE